MLIVDHILECEMRFIYKHGVFQKRKKMLQTL